MIVEEASLLKIVDETSLPEPVEEEEPLPDPIEAEIPENVEQAPPLFIITDEKEQ